MILRTASVVSTVLASLLVVACTQPPAPAATTAAPPTVDAEAEKAAIAALGAQYVALFSDKDAAGLAALYTADAVRMFPGQESSRGTDAIKAAIQLGFDNGSMSLTTHPDETIVAENGRAAIGSGTYTVDVAPPKGKPMKASGSFMNVLIKQPDGSWKIARSLVAPAPAPPPGQ